MVLGSLVSPPLPCWGWLRSCSKSSTLVEWLLVTCGMRVAVPTWFHRFVRALLLPGMVRPRDEAGAMRTSAPLASSTLCICAWCVDGGGKILVSAGCVGVEMGCKVFGLVASDHPGNWW